MIAFIQSAIADHKAGRIYQTAVDAQLYYDGENPTINRYEKIIYDMQGRAHRDMWTANHKIASRFFGIVVDQETSYLLGNGVSFKDKATKDKLGRNFDRQIYLAGEFALVGGVAFGFWNLDHVEVFQVTEFVPLEDEENGALSAGIRFWQIAPDRPLRCTLYELDGFTEYIQRPGEEMEILVEKRAYILHVTEEKADPTRIYHGENYPTFPIVPLKNNRHCKSELVGRRNTIDAIDLACSNMVNNVDEGNLIYWVLTNCGGMSEMDAVKFLDRVKTSHIAWAEGGEEGSSAEPHAIEAPFEGTQTTIDMLEKKLYQDFQAFDSSAVTAGNQSATAIKASYVPLDLKVDKFERQVTEFISGILALAGIDDEPTYTRNKIINTMEEVQTVLMIAPYVTRDYLVKKLLTILGDMDAVDEVLDNLSAEDLGRFDNDDTDTDGGGLVSAIKKAIGILAKAIGLKIFSKSGEVKETDTDDE